MRKIFSLAKVTEARIVFTEGEDDKILRAAQIVADEGICKPILLGRPDVIRARAEELTLDLSHADIIWPPDSPRLDAYVEAYWDKRRRKGMTRYDAQKVMARERRAFGMMMVDAGDADGVVSGSPRAIRTPSARAADHRPAHRRPARGGHVHDAQGARRSLLRRHHRQHLPRRRDARRDRDQHRRRGARSRHRAAHRDALVFQLRLDAQRAEPAPRGRGNRAGQTPAPRPDDRRRDAGRRRPCSPRCAKSGRFSDLKGAANVLIFPDLDSGNIAYKLLTAFGGAQAVGPILLGMRKPVTVLSQNSSVETIVHMAAITVATNGKMSRDKNGGPDPLAA